MGCEHRVREWPTGKRVQRHVNEKHHPNPTIYACPSSGCTYQTTNEPKHKRHMEKEHGLPGKSGMFLASTSFLATSSAPTLNSPACSFAHAMSLSLIKVSQVR